MYTKIKMVYWKGEKFWLGKILEHPEIMSQGETIEELEENLKDAYKLMLMDDVPLNYQLKEISVWNVMNYWNNWKKKAAYFLDLDQNMIFI